MVQLKSFKLQSSLRVTFKFYNKQRQLLHSTHMNTYIMHTYVKKYNILNKLQFDIYLFFYKFLTTLCACWCFNFGVHSMENSKIH